MRYVMWTLLAIFVPDFIGIILYFILRDSLPGDCPSCHKSVLAKFVFCPYCGASVRPVCPQCGKNIEPGWANCGHCGTECPFIRSLSRWFVPWVLQNGLKPSQLKSEYGINI